jgi:Flp pilus assembly protein TadD
MRSDSLIHRAEHLLTAGQYNKAQDMLIEAIRSDPDNPEAYYLFGDVLCKLERFGDAITMLQKADKLTPRHPRIYHLLGWAIFMNGDIPAGRSFMELALQADPENNQLYADLAVLEMRDGNLTKAQDYVLRGKRVAPDDETLDEVSMVIDKMQQVAELPKGKPN